MLDAPPAQPFWTTPPKPDNSLLDPTPTMTAPLWPLHTADLPPSFPAQAMTASEATLVTHPDMSYRSTPLTAGSVQTPTTAMTPWAQGAMSAIDSTFMPLPPPNTAAGPAGSHQRVVCESASFPGHLTGLSPMFAGFGTAGSTADAAFHAQISALGHSAPTPTLSDSQLVRPGGPIRTHSASASIPSTTGRKRSTTMTPLGVGVPPGCAGSSGSETPSFHTYPYPARRMTNPYTGMGALLQTPGQAQTQGQPAMLPPPTAPPTLDLSKVFHPNPATNFPASAFENALSSAQPDYSRRTSLTHSKPASPADAKPARFKPTKEQLEILISFYNENKNPDSAQRDALVQQLGSDIKPKTLQIWFQNRRSKARAKERDANLPKPLQTTRASMPGSRRASVSIAAEKTTQECDIAKLVHDSDPALRLLPISVLSIAKWTRFLMPGSLEPDLAAALRMATGLDAMLFFYVTHATETFRVAIPVMTNSIGDLQAAANPVLNADAVAIRFELKAGCARYAAWYEEESRWKDIGDFTGGEASAGGSCELTGAKDVLVPAFAQVHRILTSASPLQSIGPVSSGDPKFSLSPNDAIREWYLPLTDISGLEQGSSVPTSQPASRRTPTPSSGSSSDSSFPFSARVDTLRETLTGGDAIQPMSFAPPDNSGQVPMPMPLPSTHGQLRQALASVPNAEPQRVRSELDPALWNQLESAGALLPPTTSFAVETPSTSFPGFESPATGMIQSSRQAETDDGSVHTASFPSSGTTTPDRSASDHELMQIDDEASFRRGQDLARQSGSVDGPEHQA
ncbi:hypothetical protein IAU60_000554 [Kwoniella sp. DSM 27419]